MPVTYWAAAKALPWRWIGLGALVLGLWTWHLWGLADAANEAKAEIQRETAKAVAKKSEQYRDAEHAAIEKINTLSVELDKSNKARRSDSVRASAEIERLRQYANGRAAARPETAASAPRTLDACGPELQLSTRVAEVAKRLAERADALEAQVVGLQAYAKTAMELCNGR